LQLSPTSNPYYLSIHPSVECSNEMNPQVRVCIGGQKTGRQSVRCAW